MKFCISLFILFIFTGCTPGIRLEVENLTGEPIQLSYHIKNDFVPDDPWDGFEQDVNKRMEPGEKTKVSFSWSELSNRNDVTAKDYYEMWLYATAFENFSIELLERKKQINIEEIQYFSVRHEKRGTVHIYTIQIKRPNMDTQG
jgi:hypothetical protein